MLFSFIFFIIIFTQDDISSIYTHDDPLYIEQNITFISNAYSKTTSHMYDIFFNNQEKDMPMNGIRIIKV